MNKDKTKEKRAGFTPGPYWLVGGDSIYAKNEGENCKIATMEAMRYSFQLDDSEANARLIASAPELYEQCKLFERVITELLMQGETGGDYELEKLREVLAKADGRAEA